MLYQVTTVIDKKNKLDPIATGINLRTGPPAGSKQTEMARTVFFTLTVFLRFLAIKSTELLEPVDTDCSFHCNGDARH